MLTLFLAHPRFWDVDLPAYSYGQEPCGRLSGMRPAGGALMGVLMNFFMTFMAIGPIPAFPGAYLHALPFSILVSAISSCLWVKPTGMIVGKVYGGKQPV